MNVTNQTVIRKRLGVVSRSLEDSRVALRLDSAETLVFNRSGDRVWDFLDGRRTVAAVATATGHEPEVVAEFARQLIDLGLFEIVEPSAAAAAESMAEPAEARAFSGEALIPPQLLLREELSVLGGCTMSAGMCSIPSSGIGNGNGNGPPRPPPGRNK